MKATEKKMMMNFKSLRLISMHLIRKLTVKLKQPIRKEKMSNKIKTRAKKKLKQHAMAKKSYWMRTISKKCRPKMRKFLRILKTFQET